MKQMPSVSNYILAGFLLWSTAAAADGFKDIQAARNSIHKGSTAPRLPKSALGAKDAGSVYHTGATLYCSQCHVMHASEQHPQDGPIGPDPFGPYPQSFTPARNLLKSIDPVTLCLTCHDGMSGAPDVVGADVNGLADRSAGHFALPEVDNPRGHKLGLGLSSNPDDLCYRCHFAGTFATASVSCIDCHNPHGNGKARNLQWASWPGGEPEFGLYERVGSTGLSKYESANIGHGDPNDGVTREVTNMCIDCHHVFSGDWNIDPDGNGIHNRHPSYNSEQGSYNTIAQGQSRGTTDPDHWTNGAGAGFLATPRVRFVNRGATDFVSATAVSADNGVFCLSCHKAHGGDNAFALTWNPVGGINGEGCDQCHNKTVQ